MAVLAGSYFFSKSRTWSSAETAPAVSDPVLYDGPGRAAASICATRVHITNSGGPVSSAAMASWPAALRGSAM